MTAKDHTSNAPENPPQSVNSALNPRWRYFKSLQETILAASFDSAPLENNPNFIEIDEFEYRHILKEMQS